VIITFDEFEISEMKEVQINNLFTDYFNIDEMIVKGFPVRIINDLKTEDGQELFYNLVLKNIKDMEGEKV